MLNYQRLNTSTSIFAKYPRGDPLNSCPPSFNAMAPKKLIKKRKRKAPAPGLEEVHMKKTCGFTKDMGEIEDAKMMQAEKKWYYLILQFWKWNHVVWLQERFLWQLYLRREGYPRVSPQFLGRTTYTWCLGTRTCCFIKVSTVADIPGFEWWKWGFGPLITARTNLASKQSILTTEQIHRLLTLRGPKAKPTAPPLNLPQSLLAAISSAMLYPYR